MPLALELVGAALRDEGVDIWQVRNSDSRTPPNIGKWLTDSEAVMTCVQGAVVVQRAVTLK